MIKHTLAWNDHRHSSGCSGVCALHQKGRMNHVPYFVVFFFILIIALVYAAAPSLTSVDLNSTLGTNLTSENVTAYPIGVSDGDGDAVKNITDFRKLEGSTFVSWNRVNMPFEGGSNSTRTKDYSTFNNTGNVSGAIFNATGGHDGFGAYKFDGTNDYLSIADDPSMSPTKITMEAWVKFDIFGVNDLIAGKASEEWLGYGVTAIGCTAGKFSFAVYDGDWVCANSAITPAVGTWYHLVGVYSGSMVSLYVNGTLDGGPAVQGIPSDLGSPFDIGSYSADPTTYAVNGTIDDVLVYNRSLSADQILSNYNDGLAGRYARTVVHNETIIGETWQACVTPNDKTSDGSEVCSNNVTVLTEAPSLDAVILNSTIGLNTTLENITAYAINVSDPNNDSVKNITDFRLYDGSSFVSWNRLNMPFEGGSTSSFTKDYSTFSNNGTVTSATFNATAGHDGYGAYEFDAINDYVEVADDPDLDITGEITLSAWVNLNEVAFEEVIAKGGAGTGSGDVNYRLLVASGVLNFGFRDSGNIYVFVTSADGISTGSWQHVTATYDGSSAVNFYINGAADSGNPHSLVSTMLANDDHLLIGAFDDDGVIKDFANGTIDEVMIHNRTLSAEQVKALYNNKTNVLASEETVVGQTWKACVTPNDKTQDGTEVCSNNVTILPNNPPSLDAVILNSTLGTNLTTENLTAYPINSSDPDRYAVKNITDFRLYNGTDFASWNRLNMPFENHAGSASTAKDYSTFGNNGTVTSATFNSTGGYDGFGAYEFDGTSDYINVSNADGDFSFGSGDFTYSAWIKTSVAGAGDRIVADDKDLINHRALIYNVAGSTALFFCRDSGGDAISPSGTTGLGDGAWHHLVGMRKGSTGYIYVDGVLEGSDTNAAVGSCDGDTDTLIGGRPQTSSLFFTGSIDDVRIYNRSLSAEQILALNASRNNMIVHNETVTNETWLACVTPNDKIEDGSTVCSNNLTIAFPSIQQVILNSTFGTNLTTENITAYMINATEDIITNITDWRVNGTSIAVLNMPFDTKVTSNTSGAVRDYSTYEHNCTLGGGTEAYVPHWTSAGNVSGAYDFDGVNDHIVVQDSSSLNFTRNTSFTLEAWIKTDDSSVQGGSSRRVISKEGLPVSGPGYFIYIVSSTGKIAFIIANAAGSGAGSVSTTSVDDSKWHNVVGVYNAPAQTTKIYVDGVLEDTDSTTGFAGTITTSANLNIGKNSGDVGGHWNGFIDEVRVYNRTLSPEQILKNFNEGLEGRQPRTIVNNETLGGDVWQVCATPNNQEADGLTVCSNNLTIAEDLIVSISLTDSVLNITAVVFIVGDDALFGKIDTRSGVVDNMSATIVSSNFTIFNDGSAKANISANASLTDTAWIGGSYVVPNATWSSRDLTSNPGTGCAVEIDDAELDPGAPELICSLIPVGDGFAIFLNGTFPDDAPAGTRNMTIKFYATATT